MSSKTGSFETAKVFSNFADLEERPNIIGNPKRFSKPKSVMLNSNLRRRSQEQVQRQKIPPTVLDPVYNFGGAK